MAVAAAIGLLILVPLDDPSADICTRKIKIRKHVKYDCY